MAELTMSFNKVIESAFGPTPDLVPYPSGFLKTFRRHWIQNCLVVPANQLDQIRSIASNTSNDNKHTNQDDAGTPMSVDRNKLSQIIEAFLETRPPLCPIMRDLATKHGAEGFGSATTTEGALAVRKATIALRDIAIAYEELCKRSLKQNTDMLVAAGLTKEASARIAGALYKKKREATSDEVEQLTPRSSAVAALQRFDREVTFRRCRLCPDDIGKYLPHISHDTELTSLDLSGNNIHIKGAKALATTLAGLPHLHSLSLAGNNLQAEGLSLVCKAIQNRSHFRFLDISCNNGGPQTGAAIGGDLRVRHLCASGNHVTAEGILAFAPSARTAHRLVLASNTFGSGSSSDELAAAKSLVTLINTCDHLSHIDLSNNNLSVEASRLVLSEALVVHPSLVSMELSMNAFDPEALTELVVSHPQIVTLGAASQSASVYLPLAEALSANKTKMLEFRAFLTEQQINNWTNDNVRDALTYLMHRRDIAMQAPVNGALLMTIRELDTDATSLGGGMSDYSEFCDFLDSFRKEE